MADEYEPRLATVEDAEDIARLLHDFNTEFATPSPGPAVLATRLRPLLGGDRTFAVLAGQRPLAIGLVTLRTNVWYDGLVALLDELYVVPPLRDQGIGTTVLGLVAATCRARGVDLIEINVDEGDLDAQRFYQRHGFSTTDQGSTERSLAFFRELSEPSADTARLRR